MMRPNKERGEWLWVVKGLLYYSLLYDILSVKIDAIFIVELCALD